MSTEKYLGESSLVDKPKKKLNFQLIDGAVTEKKLAESAVTANKIANNTVAKEKLTSDIRDILDSVDSKLNKNNVVQETGYSETDVMSQKAVTEELDDIHDTTDNIISVLVKNGFIVEINSSRGWTFKLSNITQTRADGTYAAFTTLSVDAKWYVNNVTNKITNVKWTRDSGNKEADEIWNKAHENSKLSIPISFEDLGEECYQIGHVNFTCEAEYDANGEWQKTQKTVTF